MVRVPAQVRKQHEAQVKLLDEAIARAERVVRLYAQLFEPERFQSVPDDAAKAVSDAWNAAHDMVSALKGEKAYVEREFRFYGVDPVQRSLVANNID